jgi:hypothetical protein
MSEFKPIISHQEGQNLFPGIPTFIKGEKQGTAITMKNTKPQIALTPYGASYMQPDMEYKFAGNSVLELPQAQMGGQDQQQQLMQMIQMYAEMKGMQPEELIQKIQALPEQQQQQAIQAIAQEVQQVMAQQQQQQAGPEQQQAMMGQQGQEEMMEQEETPMAQDGMEYNEGAWQNPKGGIDYYRTVNTPTGPRVYQGSSPDLSFAMELANFKTRNTPADSTQWKTLPPHIVEKLKKQQDGGQSFLDKVTNKANKVADEYIDKILPSTLMNYNEYSTSKPIDWTKMGYYIGAKLNKFATSSPLGMLFSAPILNTNPSEEYGPQVEQQLEEGGQPCFDCFDNYNPSPQAQNLNWFYKEHGGEAFPQANEYPTDWASYSGNQYKGGGEAFPQAQTYLPYDREGETRPNFMFEMGGESDITKAYQMMKKGGFDMNPKKKKGGKFDHLEAFQKYLQDGGSNTDKAADDNGTDVPKVNSNALGYYNMMASQMGNRGLIGGLTAIGNAASVMGDVVSGLSHPGKAIKNTFGRNYDKSPRLQGAFNEFNKKNPNGITAEQRAANPVKYQGLNDNSSKLDQFGAANTTTNTKGYDYSFKPGSDMDPNSPKFKQPHWNDNKFLSTSYPEYNKQTGGANQSETSSDVFKLPEDKKKQPYEFDFQRAEGDIAKLSQIKDFAHNFNVFDKNKDANKQFQHDLNSTAFMQATESNDMGDYSTNVTQGPNFRPNSYTYAQKESKPYGPEMAIQYPQAAFGGSYQSGGSLDLYQEDGVYDLTQEEIDEIIASGGSVEYL